MDVSYVVVLLKGILKSMRETGLCRVESVTEILIADDIYHVVQNRGHHGIYRGEAASGTVKTVVVASLSLTRLNRD